MSVIDQPELAIPVEIKVEAMIELKKVMRGFNLSWCRDMAAKMFGITDQSSYEDVMKAKQRVNNILSGNARNPAGRVAFMNAAKELIAQYSAKNESAAEAQSEILPE